MKRLVAFTALLSGLLLVLVPRYILPANMRDILGCIAPTRRKRNTWSELRS
jgi:hypothetical protein